MSRSIRDAPVSPADNDRATAEESTTPDLVELSRRMIEADSFAEWAMLAEQLYAPDAVWDLGGMFGSLDGFAAIRAFVMDYWLMWDDHHHHAEEIVDLGNGVMYTLIREHGRMKGSDAATVQPVVVPDFDDGSGTDHIAQSVEADTNAFKECPGGCVFVTDTFEAGAWKRADIAITVIVP